MTKEEAIKRLIKTAKDEVGYLEKDGPYTLYVKKMSAGEKIIPNITTKCIE